MSRLLIPNSTQIPDVILDAWMAELSGGEFKVLLYIARRTYGFGKESDGISLTQMAQGITRRDGTVLDRGTGLSRASVARALKCLEDRGVIVRQTNLSESGREFEENTYRINLNWGPEGVRASLLTRPLRPSVGHLERDRGRSRALFAALQRPQGG